MKKRDLLLIIIIAIVVIAIQFIELPYEDPGKGRPQLRFHYKKSYDGLLIDKFIDSANHNRKTILIRIDTVSEYSMCLNYTDLYNYLKVGDSIIKKDWKNIFCVRRNGQDTIFDFDKFRID